MTEKKSLVGKKKIIVDLEASTSPLLRNSNNLNEVNSNYKVIVYNGIHLPNITNIQGEAQVVDAIRTAIGRGWEYRETDSGASYTNVREPFNVFSGKPIELVDVCDEEAINEAEKMYKHAITFRCQGVDANNITPLQGEESDPQPLINWACLIQTGLRTGNKNFQPLIKTNTLFHDHYHEAINPFTPEEILTKQPTGKAFFADYKTHYNERIDSKEFEDYTGNKEHIQNILPSLYGFLSLSLNKEANIGPNFDLDKILVGPNPGKPLIQPYYRPFETHPEFGPPGGFSGASTYPDVYTNLFQVYPLEALTTLYGCIGRKKEVRYPDTTFTTPFYQSSHILDRIFTKNSKHTDLSAQIEEYIKEYVWWMKDQTQGADQHGQEVRFMMGYPHKLTGETTFANRAPALENIGRNLVISSHIINNLALVNKWKKHFPFYTEIEFTAKLLTSLGDAAKQLFMTRFLALSIIGTMTDLYHYEHHPANEPDPPRGFFPGQHYRKQLHFVDFVEEKTYDTLDSNNLSSVVSPGTAYLSTKNTIRLKSLFNGWLDLDPDLISYDDHLHYNTGYVYTSADPDNTTTGHDWIATDVRNYVTFFKDNTNEFINLDNDDNQMWKSLFGLAFKAKLMNIYEQNRRTYKDILDGVPAYTEDLFYRIEKERKIAGTDKFIPVQSILIPNTSDLNIVKFVDTQMKYNSYATYRYKVYAERVVFGARYKYWWKYNNGDLIPAALQPDWVKTYQNSIWWTMSPSQGWLPFLSGLWKDTQYTDTGEPSSYDLWASLQVSVYPSIRIIEDKIFTTPEILIMDRPPVAPDVNVVPYRAVNNRIKFILSGQSDRYRAKPIHILNSDIDEFEKVQASQLSPDGKVEFGSDDPVTMFQIFRTEQRPRKYTDFSPYQMDVTSVFEEQIMPNKKYYYLFRAIDVRGHVSNPSAIYEIELIDDHGAVKPLIRTIDITAKPPKSVFDECQKYFYLKPSVKQLYFNNDPEIESIFSTTEKKKKYKIRLTSKGTGKKIDINFSFTKKV